MKDALCLLVLAVVLATSAQEMDGGECHELFRSLKDESVMQDKMDCVEELGIELDLGPEEPEDEDEGPPFGRGPGGRPGRGRGPGGRGRGPGGRGRGRHRGKRSPEMMMQFMDAYQELSEEDQTALASCVFEKQELLTEEETFDAMEFTDRILEGLLDAPDSAGRNATLDAIDNEECLLEDAEPNFMPIMAFMECLRDTCQEA